MAKPILEEQLWELIEPLLAAEKPRRYRYPGRKRIGNREVLTGIFFVLKTGIPWEYLPRELGCGCGMTCWRRLRDWQAAGVWDKLWEVVLEKLQSQHKLNWSRAAVDSSFVRAVGAGKTGPIPVDRRKAGSKHHLLTEGQGIPLNITLTGANHSDRS